MSDYSFIGNSAMVKGSWDGHTLTLWTTIDFVRDILDKPEVTGPVAEVAGKVMDGPEREAVQVGKAPAQPAPKAPEPADAEPEDALVAFLAGGQGNITVE